jgi:sugar phosphate isomerase/epimerase
MSFVAITRRELLGAAAGFAALGAATPEVLLGCQTNAWKVTPSEIETWFTVLESIRRIGFAGFETGFGNLQISRGRRAEVKSRIAATGLRFFGIHIFLLRYDPETHVAPSELYQRVADTAVTLGAERVILSGAPAPGDTEAARKAEALNKAGEFTKGLGLKLAYHNHGPEFRDGGREIRALIQGTDSALVGFVIDAGHAFRAGADLPAFLSEHHARIQGTHFRDFRNGAQVPLGAGQFPLKEVTAALQRVGWNGWALNEEEREDGSKPGDEAVQPAYAALRRAFASNAG